MTKAEEKRKNNLRIENSNLSRAILELKNENIKFTRNIKNEKILSLRFFINDKSHTFWVKKNRVYVGNTDTGFNMRGFINKLKEKEIIEKLKTNEPITTKKEIDDGYDGYVIDFGSFKGTPLSKIDEDKIYWLESLLGADKFIYYKNKSKSQYLFNLLKKRYKDLTNKDFIKPSNKYIEKTLDGFALSRILIETECGLRKTITLDGRDFDMKSVKNKIIYKITKK